MVRRGQRGNQRVERRLEHWASTGKPMSTSAANPTSSRPPPPPVAVVVQVELLLQIILHPHLSLCWMRIASHLIPQQWTAITSFRLKHSDIPIGDVIVDNQNDLADQENLIMSLNHVHKLIDYYRMM